MKHIIEERARVEMGLVDPGVLVEPTVKSNHAPVELTPKESLSKPTKKLIKRLQDDIEVVSLMPAQDFHDGQLFYAIKVQGKSYIITSRSETFSFQDAEQQGFRLEHKDVNLTRFSPSGIERFLLEKWDKDIGELYNSVFSYITRYVYFTDSSHAHFLALWVMGTYLFRVFRYYPYVWVNAEKGSGKSLLLEVLSEICFNGLLVTNPTEATIFRTVHADETTLCLDEIESLRKRDKETHGAIMSLLNSGFCKSGQVQRAEGSNANYKVRTYSTYSPKMLAGINEIDDVLQDRTVKIPLLRKKASEVLVRYKMTNALIAFHRNLRDDLYSFALKYAPQIAKIHESSDETVSGLNHLSNREKDIFEPIFVLANVIEGYLQGLGVLDAIESFSRESGAYKLREDKSENETTKLLSILVPMLDELEPVEKRVKVWLYGPKSVLDYFRQSEEFEWLDKQNALTRRLKKVGVRSKQERGEGGIRSRYYFVDLGVVKDLAERFSVAFDTPKTNTEL